MCSSFGKKNGKDSSNNKDDIAFLRVAIFFDHTLRSTTTTSKRMMLVLLQMLLVMGGEKTCVAMKAAEYRCPPQTQQVERTMQQKLGSSVFSLLSVCFLSSRLFLHVLLLPHRFFFRYGNTQ